MAKLVVSFDSEQEAQQIIVRLTQANLGEVRARVLSSSEPMSYPKEDSTSPMIMPGLGSVEVRPDEPPMDPKAMHEDADAAAAIPNTGKSVQGVQVMIEFEDALEDRVRQILASPGSAYPQQADDSSEEVGE